MPATPSLPKDLDAIRVFSNAEIARLMLRLSPQDALNLTRLLRQMGMPAPALITGSVEAREERVQLLRRGQLFGVSAVQAAVAAQQGFLEIFNNGTVNIVVMFAEASAVAGTDFIFGLNLTGVQHGTLIGAGLLRPLRPTGNGAAELEPGYSSKNITASVSTGTRATVFPQAAEFELRRRLGPANTAVVLGPWVCELPPGVGFTIYADSANQALFTGVEWAEFDPRLYP